MHPLVYEQFEKLCAERGAGGAVLEIGAVPSPESLLCLSALRGAREKIGVDLDGPSRFADFEILRANGNALTCFEDERFDTVLCNSVLEHDPFFWKTIVEMRRVARRGGLIAIGVPAYGVAPSTTRQRLLRLVRNSPLFPARLRPGVEGRLASTPTLVPHQLPLDYYRFSRRAVEEVLLGGLRDVRTTVLMTPPRVVGSGFKP